MTDSLLNIGFTQLWQLSLLILAVGTLARTVCRNRPHAAMVLWLLVLVKCVTPPIVAAPFGLFCRTAEPHVEAVASVDAPSPFAFFVKQEPVPPVDIEYLTYSEPFETLVPIEEAFEEPFEPLTMRDWLVIAWLIGTTLVVLIAFTRVVLCLRRIKRTSIDPPEELVERLEQLRSKLGIRRRVSLMITSSAIGPAVLGLFRLRIVVPEVIARDGADKLEPILAHELIHIRRGDLWVGLLSLVAKGLWWFHPLMWWVSKQISRDTERACDEDVLTALKCRPADYARSLLRVLEQKNELKAMPAFPGVRPVEITSQRMERIMSLRQGSRSGGSWRRRLLFVVAAAVVLPGAVISQDAKPLPVPTPLKKEAEEHKRQIVVKATIVEAAAADIPAAFRDIQRANVMVVTPEAKLAQEHQDKLNQRQTHSPASPQPSVSGTATVEFRSLAPKQLEAGLAALVAQKDASVLCAPKLICNDGQRASLQTSGDDLVSLEVTPRVTKHGIELKYRFEVTQQQEDGGKTVRRSETTHELTNGKALVQTGCQTDGRELVLILEADELKMAPATAIRDAGILFDKAGVEAALADFDANMTGPISGWERVLRNWEAVPVRDQEPATFLVKALLFEAAPEAKFEFATPRPTQIVELTRRVENQEPTQLNSTTFSVPIESVLENIRRLQKSHEIHVLSRPEIVTLEGQPARVEVGQQVPPQNKDDDGFRGINLTLTPTRVEGKIVLSGNLLMRVQTGQVETTEYEFRVEKTQEDLARLIRLKRGDSKPDLMLSLEAVTMQKPAPQQKRTVRVRVEGAVEAPGFYDVPIGENNLINAIAMAGGLTKNAGNVVEVSGKPNPDHPDTVRQAGFVNQPKVRAKASLTRRVSGLVKISLRANDVVTVAAHSHSGGITAGPRLFGRSYGLFDLVASDGDLMKQGTFSIDEVVRLIRDSVDARSWQRGSIEKTTTQSVPVTADLPPGPKADVEGPFCRVWVIQTIENHTAIEAMLTQLRSTSRKTPGKTRYNGSAPLVLRTHDMRDLYTKWLSDMEPKLSKFPTSTYPQMFLENFKRMIRNTLIYDSPEHRAAANIEVDIATMALRVTDTEAHHRLIKWANKQHVQPQDAPRARAKTAVEATPSQLKGNLGHPGVIQGSDEPSASRSGLTEPAATVPGRSTVRVTIHGAVRNSGVYEVPAGPNNLLYAIGLAGGLRPDHGEAIRIKRRAQGVRKVQTQGVEPASHTEPYSYTQTNVAKISNVKAGTQVVSLQDRDEIHVTVAEPGQLTPPLVSGTESWNLGFSMAMPPGLRTAHTQVKNYEQRLKKARQVLQVAREEARSDVTALEGDVKSLELQLKAAKNLERPRLGFVAQYEVERFGDRTMSDESGQAAGINRQLRRAIMLLVTTQSNLSKVKRTDDMGQDRHNLADWHNRVESRLEAARKLAKSPAEFDAEYKRVRAMYDQFQASKRPNREPKVDVTGAAQHPDLNERVRMQARTYPVADLVAPVPGTDGDLASGVAELKARVRAIMPGSWTVAGGPNSVEFNEKSLSFKIRANTQIHDAVIKTLTDLRNRQPGQVMLSVDVIQVSGKVPEFAAKRPGAMVSLVGDDFDIGGKRLMAPRLTLLSGTTAEVRTERLHLKFRAKVEGQKVIVTAIVSGKAISWVIPDGRTGLADMTSAIGKAIGDTDGKRYYLRVQADLINPVEEAVRISTPQASIPQISVTPNIIIQEEEEELVFGTLVSEPMVTEPPSHSGPKFKLRTLEEYGKLFRQDK